MGGERSQTHHLSSYRTRAKHWVGGRELLASKARREPSDYPTRGADPNLALEVRDQGPCQVDSLTESVSS